MTENFVTKPKIIAIVGPTASGKTAYAVELAKKLNGEIISADSRLVYRGFDIGTAKPDVEERQGIKHHLIDVVEPEEDYSAGLYEKHAKKAIEDILNRGKVPIVAGGTGLYFRVLLENWDLPEFDPDVELRAELQKLSNLQLLDRLRELDEAAALEAQLADKKKIIRAIEIIKNTGLPLNEARRLKAPEYDVEWIGLNLPREDLYEKINKRVDIMVENGLIEETQKLLNKHGRIKNIIETIGYKEITAYLDGTLTLEEALEKLKQNTRNYAKRQLTWFNKNEEINWLVAK